MVATVESIKCDNCDKELIEDTMYPAMYKLELRVIDTNRNSSSCTYCVSTFPPFEGTKHFCDKKCLSEWSQK